ncbi:MAG TPA: Wzz/FepE/Etk N-terminal domain-containing protein [Rhizomicrobium sp.]|nr:Wzz/FepE/Etk N-terminal domain-containing protein [Rhizomicrobium sp.]
MSEIPDESGESLDLKLIARQVWSGRGTVVACMAIGLVLAIVHLHTTAFTYTATMTLAPAQSQDAQQTVASRVSGLASLAGLDLSRNQGVSPFLIYPDVMQTRDVADDMAAHAPDIMHRLFPDQWDAHSGQWVEPKTLTRAVITLVKPVLGVPIYPWRAPNGSNLQEYIAGAVKIMPDPKRPIVGLSFSNTDPVFAVRFLQQLSDSTDRVMRRMTQTRSSQYAEYLEHKLQTEQSADMRSALIASLSQQETQLMMSSSSVPFAAQPLSNPAVPNRPTQPQPPFVLVMGIVLGGVAGALLAFFGISLRGLVEKARARLSR